MGRLADWEMLVTGTETTSHHGPVTKVMEQYDKCVQAHTGWWDFGEKGHCP